MGQGRGSVIASQSDAAPARRRPQHRDPLVGSQNFAWCGGPRRVNFACGIPPVPWISVVHLRDRRRGTADDALADD